MAQEKKKRMRMTLPKKREDLEKVVEEVEATHPEHHHHHEEDVEEFLAAFEYLLDSLNANVKVLESTVKGHTMEIARIYKILAKIVEACFTDDVEKKKKALLEALSALEIRTVSAT
jgi:hypothetical protein